MAADIGPSSVRRPISKTKQDRPTFTMKHYYQVSIADSVVEFRTPPPDASVGRCFGLQYKICANIKTASWLPLASDDSCYKLSRPSSQRRCCLLLYTECDARNLLFTIIVRCVYDAEVEQASLRSAKFLL